MSTCNCEFICALWSPAGKGLTSWLSFVVSAVSLSLSHWYPVSGVVLDCIDSWSLHPYLLCYFPISILGQVWYLIVSIPDLCCLSYFVLASHRYCLTHCVEVLQKLPLPRAVFLKGVKRAQYQSIIWKPHLSLILTNQCLTTMVRSGTVINIVPLWWYCPCVDPEGDRGSGQRLENNKYVYGFL